MEEWLNEKLHYIMIALTYSVVITDDEHRITLSSAKQVRYILHKQLSVFQEIKQFSGPVQNPRVVSFLSNLDETNAKAYGAMKRRNITR